MMTMKKQYIVLALGAMLMASCAEEFDRNFEVGRPDKTEKYAYLTEYKALKEYVSDPNFHLGVGTDAADYANQGVAYVVTNANFNETVAGNAMKMGSCVDENGNMNFGTVEAYVKEATNAGMSIYGHTLAWHAQQPTAWLKTLVANKVAPVDPDAEQEMEEVIEEQLLNGNCEGADATNYVCRDGDGGGDVNRIEDGVGVDGSRGVRIHSIDNPTNPWDSQFFITTPDHIWKAGDKYEFKMKVRADKDASISVQSHEAPGSYIFYLMLANNYSVTTEWQEFKYEGTITADQAGGNGMYTIAFNLNELGEANNYYFDDMSWKAYTQVAKPSGATIVQTDLIANGDMEGNENKNFVTKENNGPVANSTITDGVGKDGSRGVKVTAPAGAAEDWDTQFWIVLDDPLPVDTKFHVEFDYKASQDASADTQAHYNPGEYQHWACIGSPSFTTDWQHYSNDVTISGDMAGANGMKSIAFNLSKTRDADVTYYFDNIKFIIEEEIDNSEGIPQTPEELLDTLTYAMDLWIGGMMEACKNEEGTEVLVKAWDVVNEAISGEDTDGDGIYDLQHGKIKIKDLKKNDDFFWQDYMGDLEYVRTAVKKARQYGGNDQKLFINDYNLESDWDQNKKLKSLIEWIKRWEADGVTKIDGIGSQMHISYYMNANTQESKKKAIEESFKLMAASGKLVRISELDMGLVGEDGKDIATADVTEEQHHAMAEFYTWIIKKYKEIIPAAQQWGICQWCATDSPASSGWRANQPVGLWDQNYYRKHTYAGFADGLSGE
jgi:GH35 family endo-1,4-beta-xylanase